MRSEMSLKKEEALALVNEKIPFDSMQLIAFDGKNMGIVSRHQALDAARREGLDLVVIAQQGSEGLPIAKIMDFGKVLYAKKKQQADAKKHHKIIQVKELKIRPKIGDHDFQTKLNQGLQFLKEGKRLKITLMFKGREIAMRGERGPEIFNRIQQFFEGAEVAQHIVQEKDLQTPQMWSRIYYLKK
jgi:translation initiation factor IF-3